MLGHHPLPSPLDGVSWLSGAGTLELLALFVGLGALLQLTHQVAAAFGVRLQSETGQRMVYDLRYRLLDHLQNGSLDASALGSRLETEPAARGPRMPRERAENRGREPREPREARGPRQPREGRRGGREREDYD